MGHQVTVKPFAKVQFVTRAVATTALAGPASPGLRLHPRRSLLLRLGFQRGAQADLFGARFRGPRAIFELDVTTAPER